MNKKFAIAWLSIFVVWMIGSFIVHGVLLHDDYAKLPNLFRPEADAQQYFPLMILAHVIMAGAFAWIYARGVEARPWLGQGIRFGRHCAIDGGAHVHDLLRCAAHAGHSRGQADRVRWRAAPGAWRSRGFSLSQ